MRAERLKDRASVNDQIKMLARLAENLNNDPRNPMDVVCHMFDLEGAQYQMFLAEYSRPKDGDDPLEVE
jgi:hypothetical protein